MLLVEPRWQHSRMTKATLLAVLAITMAACTPTPSSEAPSIPAVDAPAATPEGATASPPDRPTASAPSAAAATPPGPEPNPDRQHRWHPTNPGGGGAFSAVALHGELIVVATDLAGIAASRDGGVTWTTRGSFAGITDTHAAAVAIDPDDPSVVYVGTDGGLYRSEDAAATFTRLAPTGFVSAVAARGPSLWVGVTSAYDQADATLLHSRDRGATWTEIPLPDGRYVVKIDVDASDRALVLTGGGRFVQSPAEIYVVEGTQAQRLDLENVTDAIFDRHDPDTLWATTDGGDQAGRLWRSDEGAFVPITDHGGVIWAPADRPGTIRLLDPRRQFPLDDEQGTWESTDAGATWARVGSVEDWGSGWSKVYWAFTDGFGGPVPSLGFDPTDGERAALVNAQFAYLTVDGGRSFRPAFTDEVAPDRWRSRGIDNVVVADIAIGAYPEVVYPGYWDLGCFVSVDGGDSWANCNTTEYSGDWEGSGGFTGTVVADPERPGTVWAAHAPDWASDAVMLRSEDHAASWTDTSGIPPGPDLLGLALDPSSPTERRTLAVTAGGDVYVSTDDGETWTLDFACGGCRTTAFGPNGTLYAGGEAGLWQRGPDGWAEVEGDFGGEVGGPPWEYDWRGVSSVAVDGGGTVWVTVLGEEGGIYRGDGHSFELVRPGRFYRDVAVDPDDPNTVYLASSSALEQGGYDPESRGLEVTTDGGRTWRQTNDGLAWPFVTNIAVHPEIVVIGSPGTGVAVPVTP